MKLILGVVVLTVACILAPRAAADDLVTSRTVLKDASGALTIADVARRDGTPVGQILATGSTDSALWMRVQVRAPAQGSKVVLYILPTYLNEVRLYEAGPGNPATWETRVTGNRYSYDQRDRNGTSLGFVVNVTAPEATYYLRFKNMGRTLISVEALSPEEAIRKDHRRDLLEVFFVTSMLFLLLWAILNYLLDRQPVVGLFAIYQAAYTLFGIVATGYLAPLLGVRFPHLVDWVDTILYLAINFTTVLFCRELFKPYKPPPAMMRVLTLLLWAYPFLLAGLAVDNGEPAVRTNAFLIRLTWIFLAAVAFSLRVECTPRRRLLQAFFTFVLLNNFLFWYIDRGSIPTSRADLGMVQILIVDGLVIGGLLALMLYARTRQVLREGQESALKLLLAQERFETEHELKKHIEVEAWTDYLTGLSNRRHFVELAERELARAIRFQRPLSLLVIDFDHFKEINDTWGHRAGDVVLKEVSRLLRQALRDEDIFGRIGGEEFAVVMVETEGEDAIEVAQRLCATVAEASIVPQDCERIHVNISIGLAQLNNRKIDFNNLLNKADQAMYGAKQAGRNQVFISE
ncbi:MAG: GGDEF domain-containing protein [Terracidiphilus sp.]|nr:GGDEF domain-containing protein [Terracidiphilus sp.]